MFVKITKGSQYAWWKDYVGTIIQVREPNDEEERIFQGTHWALVKPQMLSLPRAAIAISKKSCTIVDVNYHTNRGAKHLLFEEE